MARVYLLALPLLLTLGGQFVSVLVEASATFTLINKCQYPIWPGILSGAGSDPLPTTGFALQVGESRTIQVPTGWGGRLWARTLCSQDSTGKFSCVTGDCGSGKVECDGGNGATPVTLAEFKLDGYGSMDFYDVSLVDGYNLPLLVIPQGGTGPNCNTTGCAADLNGACPSALQVAAADGSGSVACKSACDAFGQEQYCCSGAYSTPDTCKPSSYSQVFKSACPLAYSYAYDDKTSTFTCASGADYIIAFCPAPNTSQKSSLGTQNADGSSSSSSDTSSAINGSMTYSGAAAPSRCMHVLSLQAIAGAVAFVAAIWGF